MVSLETSSDFPIYVTDTVHFVGFYLKFLPNFSQQNWRVIFEGFQSNFNFAWLNSTSHCLMVQKVTSFGDSSRETYIFG